VIVTIKAIKGNDVLWFRIHLFFSARTVHKIVYYLNTLKHTRYCFTHSLECTSKTVSFVKPAMFTIEKSLLFKYLNFGDS